MEWDEVFIGIVAILLIIFVTVVGTVGFLSVKTVNEETGEEHPLSTIYKIFVIIGAILIILFFGGLIALSTFLR